MKNYQDFKDNLNEAVSIGLDELPEKDAIEKFIKANNVTFLDLFDGIHGKILMVDTQFSGHLDKKDNMSLCKLLTNASKIKTFRWIGVDSNINGVKLMRISIGF